MGSSDRLARALRTLSGRFPPPPDWEPAAERVGTENPSPDQGDGRPVPTVPAVPTKNEEAAQREADASAAWQERAAILEYDGGFSRAEAEARATAELGALLTLRDRYLILSQTDTTPQDTHDSVS